MRPSQQSSSQRFFNILELVESVVEETYIDYKDQIFHDYHKDAFRFLRSRMKEFRLVNKNFCYTASKVLVRDISLVETPQPPQADVPRHLRIMSSIGTRSLVRALRLGISHYVVHPLNLFSLEPYDEAGLRQLTAILKRFENIKDVDLITMPSHTPQHLHLIKDSFERIRELHIYLRLPNLVFPSHTLSFLDRQDFDHGRGSLNLLFERLWALKISILHAF